MEAPPLPFVIPTEAYPDFLPHSSGQGRVFALRKEGMKCDNATKPYRKSGEPSGGICSSTDHSSKCFRQNRTVAQ